jgi:hypothetical protein
MKNIKKIIAISLVLIASCYVLFDEMIASAVLIISFVIVVTKFLLILSKKESINQFE